MSDHDDDRTPPGAAPAVPGWERDRPWVVRRNVRTGETKTYLAQGTQPEQAAGLPKHIMQCVTITQDCGACHQVLAMEDSSPDILKTLGLWDQIETLKGH